MLTRQQIAAVEHLLEYAKGNKTKRVLLGQAIAVAQEMVTHKPDPEVDDGDNGTGEEEEVNQKLSTER